MSPRSWAHSTSCSGRWTGEGRADPAEQGPRVPLAVRPSRRPFGAPQDEERWWAAQNLRHAEERSVSKHARRSRQPHYPRLARTCSGHPWRDLEGVTWSSSLAPWTSGTSPGDTEKKGRVRRRVQRGGSVNWTLYVIAMVLLVVSAPVVGWLRLRPHWDRHPAGSRGVLRDQLVTRAPWAVMALAFALYVAFGGEGRIAAPLRNLIPLAYAAVGLTILACSGFVPPIMDARQRLMRLRQTPRAKRPAGSSQGA